MLTLDADTIEAINSAEVRPLALYSVEFDDNSDDAPETPDAWAGSTTYSVGDYVSYDGNEYVCIKHHVSNASFPPDFDWATYIENHSWILPNIRWLFHTWRLIGALPDADDPTTMLQSPLRFTNWSEEVVYDGNTYIPWGVKHSGAKQAGDGRIQNVILTVANIDEHRIIQRIIEDFSIIGSRVTITEMFEGAGGVIENTYTIISAQANKGQVAFKLSIGFSFLNQTVPKRKAYRDHCRWVFQDECCKYDGAETSCDKTFKTCRDTMNNSSRYGGFLGIKNEIYWR